MMSLIGRSCYMLSHVGASGDEFFDEEEIRHDGLPCPGIVCERNRSGWRGSMAAQAAVIR
ncbi:MAG TPA: hypothetical protein VEK15_18715 [Vicinamibacteria bacterium]|nr:hypothetical protein [Vicinamibacteria bacterium]